MCDEIAIVCYDVLSHCEIIFFKLVKLFHMLTILPSLVFNFIFFNLDFLTKLIVLLQDLIYLVLHVETLLNCRSTTVPFFFKFSEGTTSTVAWRNRFLILSPFLFVGTITFSYHFSWWQIDNRFLLGCASIYEILNNRQILLLIINWWNDITRWLFTLLAYRYSSRCLPTVFSGICEISWRYFHAIKFTWKANISGFTLTSIQSSIIVCWKRSLIINNVILNRTYTSFTLLYVWNINFRWIWWLDFGWNGNVMSREKLNILTTQLARLTTNLHWSVSLIVVFRVLRD